MNTIFTKSEKSDPHRLILNLSEKKQIQKGVINMLHYQILVSIKHEKNKT